MATTDKDLIKHSIEWCQQEAEAALDRGLNFAAVAGGQAVSGQSDFERAGALFAAAEALKARTK